MTTKEIPVGVAGLGLMGGSIATCLLMAAHPVIAAAPISDDMEHAESRIRNHFSISQEHGIIQEAPEYYFRNLLITDDYAQRKDCKLIIECTMEDDAIKKSVY